MIAVLVNAGTIIIGSLIGLLIKNNIKKSITDAIMIAIGLFTVYMGITGLASEVNSIVYLLALVFGGVIGTLLNLEDNINKFALKVQKKLSKGDEENRFASGFVGFFIISCVGAYTIVASFNCAVGDYTMMLTKAVMDFVVSMAMASSLGIGVMFAVVPTILYETVFVLFSGAISTIMSEAMVSALSCMGAILTVAIGLNVAKVTKFKVVNYIPSLVLAPLFAFLAEKYI